MINMLDIVLIIEGVAGEGVESLCHLVTIGKVTPYYSEINLLFYTRCGNTYGMLTLLFLSLKISVAYVYL